MKEKTRNLTILIFLISLFCFYLNLPAHLPYLSFSLPSPPLSFLGINRPFDLKLGLDLAGGVDLTFLADTASLPKQDHASALESLRENIEKRVNLFGLTEAVVQTSQASGQDRLLVQLPGSVSANQAIDLIGRTASLDFRGEVELAPEATATATLFDLFGEETNLGGAHLERSKLVFDPNTGSPQVSLQFNDEGSRLFEEITQKFTGKRLAIFLDEFLLTAPLVQEPISGGQAVISGQFDNKSAQSLVAQLNAGALPVSLELLSQKEIGPTLGQETIQKGIKAGLVGLLAVAVFMVLNYHLFGVIAVFSLFIYTLITLALYRIIPVTLTFPGIVGFLLSVGMAVDSNILIFERFKEERQARQIWPVALERAFGRAWDSIRDANLATLITAFILFNPFDWSFLPASGMLRGFASTLALGIFISLFTGIIVTRTFLRLLPVSKKERNSPK